MATESIPASMGLQVLVVDDDPTNRMFARWLLAKLGCSCEEAVDGLQALECVQQHSFDVILMDCFMPELDGCDATRRIRHMERHGRLAGPPRWILGVTACPSDSLRRESLAAGMNDFMAKPYRLRDLQEHLEGIRVETPSTLVSV
jgi:CheY-like chemotaxis protein